MLCCYAIVATAAAYMFIRVMLPDSFLLHACCCRHHADVFAFTECVSLFLLLDLPAACCYYVFADVAATPLLATPCYADAIRCPMLAAITITP